MPNLAKLILLDSVTPITLDAANALPTRMRLMKWGENPGAKGTFIINGTTLAQLPKNQKATNFDTIALDFEHNSVKGSSTYKGEPVKVAAHGTPEVVDGDGLYLNNITWTPEGREHVGGGHYKDLSPSILTNDKNEVTFIHSAAACRQGALVDAPITLSASEHPALFKLTNDPMREHLITLLTAAGITIPTDATDAQLAQLVKDNSAKFKTLSAAPVVDAPKVADPALAETLKTLNATLGNLTVKIEKLEGKQTADEISLICNAAAVEGKVIPKEFLEGDTKLGAAQLKLLVANLPVTVPVGERKTPTNLPPSVSGVLITNSADEEVRKTLGITKEAWDKHNKAA